MWKMNKKGLIGWIIFLIIVIGIGYIIWKNPSILTVIGNLFIGLGNYFIQLGGK